jgi:hypothetical protein
MTGDPGAGGPDARIVVKDGQGVQVGSHNVQTNYFTLAAAGATEESFVAELGLHRSECVTHCPKSEDGKPLLDGRRPERGQIAAIAGSGTRFCWVQAPMSHGKTAVAAWFTLDPPPGTVALACFVGPTTSGDQFLDILIRRLSAWLRYAPNVRATLQEKPVLLTTLLERAEVRCVQDACRLAIVVDGLDEDPLSPGVMPVAQVLPGTLPEHVHLIVFSRPYPGPLPSRHPLRAPSARYDLPRAEEAHVETERAQEELDQVTRQGALPASILTMLAVAGPLTETDLVDLLAPDIAREVGLAFAGPLRRLTYTIDAPGGPSHEFGHIALHDAWTEGLGRRATAAAIHRIDAWADGYAGQGWPASTPPYCLDGYAGLLVRRGEATRLAAIALDEARRARLLAVTGSRVAEAAVIAQAQQSVSSMAAPDIGLATRLALESLIVRNSLEEAARPEMVGFDVRRGEVRKAIDTVLALSPGADHWSETYVELVASLYLTGRDDMAAALLRRAATEHPGARLTGPMAERVAAERPDLAVRLAGDNPWVRAAIAPSLALHDDFADQAVDSVRDQPELQLAVALALAPRQPEAALRAVADFAGFSEWSAGAKLWRGGSFARVEVARAMTSADAALDVLTAERDGSDGRAALVAMGVRLAGHDRRDELAGSLSLGVSPADLLARFALGQQVTALVDEAVADGPPWAPADLDLLQRFDPVLTTSPAVIRADYARLLRSVQFTRLGRLEAPEQAAQAILVQLLVIDDLGPGDAELVGGHFRTRRVAMHEVRGAAATRIAAAEPRRAAGLALDSGPTSTWTLRDVLRHVATRDLRLAVELTDIVDASFSGTRSVVLGAVGAMVNPGDTAVIEELSRRVSPPAQSSVVRYVLADSAARVGGLLPDGDERASRLLEWSETASDMSFRKGFRLERSIALARAGEGRAAVDLLAGGGGKPSAVGHDRGGWTRLAALLAADLAGDVLKRRVLPSAKGRERDWALCALAALDPVVAVGELGEDSLDPRTYAEVLRLASEKAEESGTVRELVATVSDLVGRAPAHEAVLLAWAAGRIPRLGEAVAWLPAEYEPVLAGLGGEEATSLADACDRAGLEPDFFLAAWVYDRPARLRAAVETIAGRHRDEASYLPERISLVVSAAVAADSAVAAAIIDEIDWPSVSRVGEGIRDESNQTLIRELVRSDPEAAWRRVDAIGDGWKAIWTLASLAAAACRSGYSRGPALADILAAAHARAPGTMDLARHLEDELSWIDEVSTAAVATLLAETNGWPAAESTWMFGPLFGLLRGDRESAAGAADAILACAGRLNSPP